MDELLTTNQLRISYGADRSPVVSDLSFTVQCGETLGICGKSGCGKSSVALAIMGMLSYAGGIATGSIFYSAQDLLKLSEKQMREVRWREISMVPQSSMNALNPVYRIKKTLEETIKAHCAKDAHVNIERRCEELMELVHLGRRELLSFPHELSGGMRQRISIALALALSPRLIILDEATTGLDVLVEADILHTIGRIKKEKNLSLLFITHDIRLQQAFCDRRITL